MSEKLVIVKGFGTAEVAAEVLFEIASSKGTYVALMLKNNRTTGGASKMPYRTNNPEADFNRWDADQTREAARYPVCVYCGYSILDDKLFDFNGDTYHIDWAEEEFKKDTEDYME